ncbi:MAG: hypothetical protein RLY58_2462 [Pseudomonadota bacterium]|jgi:hypothetical protein
MTLPDANQQGQQANGFSGSYAAADVTLLLHPLRLDYTDVAEKERLIQSGQKHYSEMLSQESAPSDLHQRCYQQALAAGLDRLACEVQSLALALQQTQAHGQPIVLVSLVRAGLPIGVMLKHALSDLGCVVQHYGVSIIRDRGLDPVAYAWLRQRYAYAQLIFVDGWTGKGAISRELSQNLCTDPDYDGVVRLLTLADVSGMAWLTASADDWLIPSGILGSTVSGLISRTVYQADQWHGCQIYHDLAAVDVSQALIDQVNQTRRQLPPHTVSAAVWPEALRQQQQQQASRVIAELAARFDVQQPNRIKPSIAEATRAVLRRVPDRVLLRDANDPHTALLCHLAAERGAPVDILGDALGPYRAVTIIQRREKPSVSPVR